MSENERISVIIPTYNRPDFLKRAVDSVLAQTHDNMEVIVVDDNDPETEARQKTEKVMDSYQGNPKVIYVKQASHQNGSAARNAGFQRSTGQYIALLDDDDEFLPVKMESQLLRLKEKSNCIACYSRYVRIGKNGRVFDKSCETREGKVYVDVLARNFYSQGGSNLLLKREAFEKVVGFDESFDRNQDIEFMARLFQNGEIAYCDTLGLKIYLPLSPRKVDGMKTAEKYKSRFAEMISQLSDEDQEYIEKQLALQIFRFQFLHFHFRGAVRELKMHHVPFSVVVRYGLYLVKRRITKTIYGFHMNRGENESF